MSRYDIDLFTTPPDPELLCAICRSVIDGPCETPCRHVFCKVCIETWLNLGHTCPTCRKWLSKDRLKPGLPLLANMINRLKVYCKHQFIGCRSSFTLESAATHEKECGYAPIRCRNQKCRKKILRREVEQHETVECKYRTILCEKGCDLHIAVREIDAHHCLTALKNYTADIEKGVIDFLDSNDMLQKAIEDQQSRLRIVGLRNYIIQVPSTRTHSSVLRCRLRTSVSNVARDVEPNVCDTPASPPAPPAQNSTMAPTPWFWFPLPPRESVEDPRLNTRVETSPVYRRYSPDTSRPFGTPAYSPFSPDYSPTSPAYSLSPDWFDLSDQEAAESNRYPHHSSEVASNLSERSASEASEEALEDVDGSSTNFDIRVEEVRALGDNAEAEPSDNSSDAERSYRDEDEPSLGEDNDRANDPRCVWRRSRDHMEGSTSDNSDDDSYHSHTGTDDSYHSHTGTEESERAEEDESNQSDQEDATPNSEGQTHEDSEDWESNSESATADTGKITGGCQPEEQLLSDVSEGSFIPDYTESVKGTADQEAEHPSDYQSESEGDQTPTVTHSKTTVANFHETIDSDCAVSESHFQPEYESLTDASETSGRENTGEENHQEEEPPASDGHEDTVGRREQDEDLDLVDELADLQEASHQTGPDLSGIATEEADSADSESSDTEQARPRTKRKRQRLHSSTSSSAASSPAPKHRRRSTGICSSRGHCINSRPKSTEVSSDEESAWVASTTGVITESSLSGSDLEAQDDPTYRVRIPKTAAQLLYEYRSSDSDRSWHP